MSLSDYDYPSEKPKWTLLIVEDEDDLRSLLSEKLTSQGHRVLAAQSVSDALRMLSNQPFDCVLLDMHLARDSGERIISYMRSNVKGFNHYTPILVISGLLDAELVKRIGKEVNGILVKPFGYTDLISKISTIVNPDSPAIG